MTPPIRLAIVDDARFIREALARLLAADRRVEVVGTASSGEELLAQLETWRPDAITLDLEMPGLGGLETLRRLMADQPLPVIILSTHSGEGAPVTMEALSLGAADFVDKEAYSLVDFQALREVLVSRLLHVTGRTAPAIRVPATPRPTAEPAEPSGTELVGIGASTGGPRAVEQVLRAFGSTRLPPIIVAQHMPEGFTRAFAERLDRTLDIAVAEAVDGERLTPGLVRVAPAGRHLIVERGGEGLVTRIVAHPEGALHRPSVDVMLRSVAQVVGRRALGVLLTGMGSDGAQGMLEMVRCGGHTIAEDETTCVVYGMPRAAVECGGASEILPLPAIGPRVAAMTRTSAEHEPGASTATSVAS